MSAPAAPAAPPAFAKRVSYLTHLRGYPTCPQSPSELPILGQLMFKETARFSSATCRVGSHRPFRVRTIVNVCQGSYRQGTEFLYGDWFPSNGPRMALKAG